jgi:hypothetical protein
MTSSFALPTILHNPGVQIIRAQKAMLLNPALGTRFSILKQGGRFSASDLPLVSPEKQPLHFEILTRKMIETELSNRGNP